MKTVFRTAFLLAFGVVNCAKLPITFQKCDRNEPNFTECLTKAVNNATHQLTKPFREVGLPSIEPLDIPSLTIGAGTSAVGLQQKFTNVKIHGLSKGECKKIEADFQKKTITNDCSYDIIKMEADYELKGKVLLLDVRGTGKATITLEKVKTPSTYYYDEYEKNGQKYFKIIKTESQTEPEHVTYHFDNLFNGDKILGENINQVLNDNWKQVYDDVKPSYSEAFGQIAKAIFNNLLEKVPAVDVFGKE